jgi:diguanylate cyclase (GGDEF)-like protein
LLLAILDGQPNGQALYQPVTGPDGCVSRLVGIYMNPVGLALRGFSSSEFLGSDLLERTRGNGNDDMAAAYLHVATSGEPMVRRLVTDGQSGRRRVYDVDAIRVPAAEAVEESTAAPLWLVHLAFRDVTHDIDGRRRLEQTATDLELLARTDPLTGLLNRRGWEPELAAAVRRAASAPGLDVCVAIMDLDRFKDYNDRHGHAWGDDLLRELAGAWRGVGSPALAFSRLGGEEFAAIFEMPLGEAVRACHELRALVPRDQTASVGVTQWKTGELPETTLGRADAALYAAKRQGRDRLVALAGP